MYRLALYKPGRLFKLFTALTLLVIGSILILPGSTFDTGVIYDSMRKLASEQTWGIFIFSVGLFKIITFNKPANIITFVVDLIALGLWIFITVMIAMITYISISAGVYGMISICEIIRIIYLRKGDT